MDEKFLEFDTRGVYRYVIGLYQKPIQEDIKKILQASSYNTYLDTIETFDSMIAARNNILDYLENKGCDREYLDISFSDVRRTIMAENLYTELALFGFFFKFDEIKDKEKIVLPIGFMKSKTWKIYFNSDFVPKITFYMLMYKGFEHV